VDGEPLSDLPASAQDSSNRFERDLIDAGQYANFPLCKLFDTTVNGRRM
jgi:hypothetical protein